LLDLLSVSSPLLISPVTAHGNSDDSDYDEVVKIKWPARAKHFPYHAVVSLERQASPLDYQQQQQEDEDEEKKERDRL